MKFKSNLTRITYVASAVVITALLIAGTIWAYGEEHNFLGHILLVLSIMSFVFCSTWYWTLLPESQPTKPGLRSLVSRRGIPIHSNGRNVGNVFMSQVKSVIQSPDEPQPEDYEFDIVLPNGVPIGNARMYHVILRMMITRESARAKWIGKGVRKLTRREWEGVIAWMAESGLVIDFDGRGHPILTDGPYDKILLTLCH